MRRFLRATVDAVRHIKTNPEGVLPLLVEEYKLDDPEMAREMLNEVGVRLMPRAPYPTIKMFDNTIRNLATTNAAVAQLRPENLIEPRFIKEMEDDGFLRRIYGE